MTMAAEIKNRMGPPSGAAGAAQGVKISPSAPVEAQSGGGCC